MIQHHIQPEAIPKARTWHGHALPPHEEVLMFHRGEGPVPEMLSRLTAALERERLPYLVIGAVALAAYGYRRATEDVDICMRAPDLDRFRETLVGSEYQAVEGRPRRFYDPTTQVTVDILIAGDLAGHRGKNLVVRFPDPDEMVRVGDLKTVSLERLIDLKLVTWRYKDWGDVVELIRRNGLNEAFADRLDRSTRLAFLQCLDQATDPQYGPM